MEKRDLILTNFKKIDYEGLKMEQSLLDMSVLGLESGDFVNFENIYFGLISMN